MSHIDTAQGVITSWVMDLEDNLSPVVTPEEAKAIIEAFGELQAKLEKAQQDIEYLADRVPEVHHNGMMQLSQHLAETRRQLEAVQRERDEYHQRLANAEYQLEMAGLAKFNLRGQRKAQFRMRRAAEAELKRRDEQEPVGEVIEIQGSTVMDGSVHLNSISYRALKGQREMKLMPVGTKFYAAAPAVVIPSEVSASDAECSMSPERAEAWASGANWMREQILNYLVIPDGCRPAEPE